ncbi:presenilins-associated rhomboid-like protein, mitochondrial [Actinia tenebrosa]|uniref:rhomboid protease n=1 Tax=Actinia tenebrosa TaxID=6105 RepID=A0A6P8H1H6_ACTTE|nr:presenilins-associated rhomboid-like protein, mitochondrial [Actinia tenebrosa]
MANVGVLFRQICESQRFGRFFFSRGNSLQCRSFRLIRNESWKTNDHNGVEELVVTSGRTRLIMRPLVFTVVASGGSFVGCAILQYERIRASYSNWSQNIKSLDFPKLFGFRQKLNRWWKTLPDGRKTATGIIFLNAVVFLLWKIPTPQVQSAMWRWFVSHPIIAPPLTLLTSCFSHIDFWHVAINMYVLWSFAPTIEALLGKEQFIAFYLSGGIIASFASQAFRILAKQPIRPSLGASGALFAVLSYVCISLPDTELALVFLPWFTFSAGKALMGVVALDVAGLLFRWQMFDHAAHLGGAVFGALYLKYGHHYLWDKRGWLIKKWHRLRGKSPTPPPS